MTNYLGNDIYEIDGIKYSIKKAKSEELLTTWKCPHCGHSELSYKDDQTQASHFESCKVYKKKLKNKQL